MIKRDFLFVQPRDDPGNTPKSPLVYPENCCYDKQLVQIVGLSNSVCRRLVVYLQVRRRAQAQKNRIGYGGLMRFFRLVACLRVVSSRLWACAYKGSRFCVTHHCTLGRCHWNLAYCTRFSGTASPLRMRRLSMVASSTSTMLHCSANRNLPPCASRVLATVMRRCASACALLAA